MRTAPSHHGLPSFDLIELTPEARKHQKIGQVLSNARINRRKHQPGGWTSNESIQAPFEVSAGRRDRT